MLIVGPYRYNDDGVAPDTVTLVSLWRDDVCFNNACVSCDGGDEAMGWCATFPRAWSFCAIAIAVLATLAGLRHLVVGRLAGRRIAVGLALALVVPWHTMLVDDRERALAAYWWFAGALAMSLLASVRRTEPRAPTP